MSKPTPKIPIAALPAEADALTRFDQLHSTLSATHEEIPQLLAGAMTLRRQLGLAEAEGRDASALRESLAEAEGGRESAARKRAACIDAIMQLEPALQSERAGVEKRRQAYATHALAQFRERYDGLVSELQGLWETGRALGIALRCEVPMPLPVKLMTSPVDGVARAMPVRSGDAPPLDEEAQQLGEALDRVDGALSLCNAIRQSAVLEDRHSRLATSRSMGAGEYGGLYKVLAPFQCQVDGLEFLPGQLLDGSLISAGMAHRLMAGRRYIAPLNLESAAA